MKNKSHLSLVDKNAAVVTGKGNGAFQVVSLSELSRPEILRVEKAVSEVSKKAAILGVAVTPRSWDLRPVVIVAEEGTPSLIRFLGPEVTLSLNIHTRMKDLLERIAVRDSLRGSAKLLEWGVLEGQLWYRREMVERVLSEELVKKTELPFVHLKSFCKTIVETLQQYHQRGIVHGHIVSGNVAVDGENRISLLDAGVAASVLQGLQKLGIEQFPQGYDRQSFAPELFNSEAVNYGTDTYGLGLLFKELFQKQLLKLDGGKDRDHQAILKISGLISSMTDTNPEYRPSLTQIRDLLEGEEKKTLPPGKEAILRQGRILMPGRVERGKIIHPTKAAGNQQEKKKEEEPKKKSPERAKQKSLPEKDSTKIEKSPAEVKELVASAVVEDNLPVPSSEIVQKETQSPMSPALIAEARSSSGVIGESDSLSSAGIGVSWRAKTRSASLAALTFYTVLGAAVLVFLGYYFQGSRGNYSPEELESAWVSNRPSMMATVAREAVDGRPNELAINLIISSAMKGEEHSSVNSSLLRIAFDERWESELTPADRRLALSLSLTGILGEDIPTDLEPLEKAHPGVILAVASSAGANVQKVLNSISVSLLTSLPPPLGVAFQELVRETSDLRAGDESVLGLSKLATNGIEESEGIISFLAHDTKTRLRALAYLFAQDNAHAKQILEILLRHPNLRLDYSTIRWAKTMDLTSWSELESSEQLLLVAGVIPTKVLEVKNLAKLFSHPDDLIRTFAIKKGIDTIPFEHPGAYEALSYIAQNPRVLSGADTLLLAEFLQQPGNATAARVRVLLESSPAEGLISMLLISTSGQTVATPLDFEFSRYLQDRNWEPSLTEIRKLVFHPEKLTRFFAYTKAFSLSDADTAREILTSALEKEANPEFRSQLTEMLEKLTI